MNREVFKKLFSVTKLVGDTVWIHKYVQKADTELSGKDSSLFKQ